jgi:hypothetical protein
MEFAAEAPDIGIQICALASSPGNEQCADCDSAGPSWASVNNGVFICTACSGVHRSLGVEYSFVQSVTMDKWTDENYDRMLRFPSNITANESEYEYRVPSNYRKPLQCSSRESREQYIVAKYKDRLFVPSARSNGTGPQAPVFEDKNTVSSVSVSSIGEVEFVGVLILLVKSCKDLINADTFGRT